MCLAFTLTGRRDRRSAIAFVMSALMATRHLNLDRRMPQIDLVDRLERTDPGWPEWNQLIDLARSLTLQFVADEYLGNFVTAGSRLTFAVPAEQSTSPAWLPPYVRALVGLKAAEYAVEGGFGDAFTGETTQEGFAFAGHVPDEQLGYPVISVPSACFHFQRNESGALFHVNSRLEILFPDASRCEFRVLDTLEAFTQKNIRMALEGRPWFRAYAQIDADILD
jgi:hypothetical protein